MISNQKLILDTCALLWLTEGSTMLSVEAKHAIDCASLVFVSAISAWEISLKVARKQLALPLPPLEWFEKSVEHHNLLLAPLDINVLTSANELPWHHKDPADRFIIATAIHENAVIVTADKKMAQYGTKVII